MDDLFREPIANAMRTVNELFEEVLEEDEEVVVFVFGLHNQQTAMLSQLSLATVVGLVGAWLVSRLEQLAKEAKQHLDA